MFRTVATVCFTLLLVLTAAPHRAAAADRKPDVLFIAIDDLNDWIGCLGGHPQAITPNMDKLAARGTLFANAHCAAPACNPSRAALMSGSRPWTTGIYHNGQPYEPILKDVLTLGEHFRDNGYRVVAGGKIYHGGAGDDRRWDEVYKRPADPDPVKKSLSGLNKSHFDWGALDTTDEQMGDYKMVTWAGEQLATRSDKPLFLAVGFIKPHLPFYAPKDHFKHFPLEKVQLPKTLDTDLDDVPQAGVRMAKPDGDHADVLEHDQWHEAVQSYLATIHFVDAQIGRLLDALDRSGRADNTIIVLWGDHGWHLGEKRHWRKFALWDEATQAPLMFVAPGVGKPNSVTNKPVDFMSIYPTLCDLAGIATPKHVQGPSLRPLIENPNASWDHLAVTTHGRGNHGVRSERYRYIRYADGSEELYDHQSDPLEWTNLAMDGKHEQIKRDLARAIPKKEAADAPRENDRDRKKRKNADD